MSLSDADTWVSIRAVAWVIDDAPVPADLAFVLAVIARRCDENGRGSYQSLRTISEKTGKSEDQAARDIKRLRELGLILLGDQSLPEKHGVPKGRRPVVYDLPLDLKGPKPVKGSKNPSGRKKQPTPGMDATPSEEPDPPHASTPTPRFHAGPSTCMEATPPPCMHAPQITQKKTGKKTINPSARARDADHPSAARADRVTEEKHQQLDTRASEATCLADDAAGRRWLVRKLLLSDEEAAEVVAVVRHRWPRITCMPKYLERMHYDDRGEVKEDLLVIIEAVQAATRPQVDDEFELEPDERPACGHSDATNTLTGGCVICETTDAKKQPAPEPEQQADEAFDLAQLLSQTRGNIHGTRDRMRIERPASKPVVAARIPYSPDSAGDTRIEAAITRDDGAGLPHVKLGPRERTASA